MRILLPVACGKLGDPGIFKESGRTYLVYSIAGESGLAIAELFR